MTIAFSIRQDSVAVKNQHLMKQDELGIVGASGEEAIISNTRNQQ
jgi:hypothetical protein